jgi:tetratricopeptide (TPR) repeat protein
MADACAALHYNEAELVYLKQALDAEPKNIEVNRHCARSLGRMGQFDQAIACWHRIEKLTSQDEEATRMISVLAQEKLKYPGGRPPVLKPKQLPPEIEECHSDLPHETGRDVILRPEQKLEQAIAHDPQNLNNYLELAELLLSSTQYNLAETVLNRGISACGEQQPLVEKLHQVRLLRAEDQRQLDEKRALAQKIADAPIRIPWLELVLGITFLVLLLQVAPSLAIAIWRSIDIRNWEWGGWLSFNLIVLLGLILIRTAPTLRALWLRRKIQRIYRNRNA